MGFNVQGIATSLKTKNIATFIPHLEREKATDGEMSYLEAATSSHIEDNDVYIIPAENGTILTAGFGIPIYDVSLEELSINGKALKYMVGETAMMFVFDYYENGELIRSVSNHNGRNMQEKGEPLAIEKSETDFTEIIFTLMQEVTGDSIYTLEPDAKAEKYTLFI
jgi:hypothetical protein